MRAGWLLVPLALVACKREPSFDERYDNAQGTILNTSAELDNEMRAMATDEAADRRTPQAPPPRR